MATFNISAAASLGTVRKTTTMLGTTLPKRLTAAIERADALSTKTRGLLQPDNGEDLPRAFIAAVEAGNDPAADPEVQRLTMSALLLDRGIVERAQKVMDSDLRDALNDTANDIVSAWREVLTADAATLVDAHKKLRGLDLDNTQDILRLGGDAAQTWAKAAEAHARIQQAREGWGILASATRFAPMDPHRVLLRIAAPTLDQWRQLDGNTSAWDLVGAGLTLDLADADTYRERNTALDKAINAERDKAERDNINAMAGRRSN